MYSLFRCLAGMGLYNGAVGEVLDIVYRPGGRRPRPLPACVLVEFPKYCGPVFPPELPTVAPEASIERIMDCRCRCARATIPLIPARGITFHKSQGATCGSGRDAECVVSRPAKPSVEKSHPCGLYAAFSSAKSAGRGVYGAEGFAPSALYLQAIFSRGRVLLRVDNAITAGRDRAVRRIAKLAAATKARWPDLIGRFPALVERAMTPLPPGILYALFNQP